MKSLLNTIIIDDDLVATEQLKSELVRYSMLNICGNAYSGADGRNLLLEVNPDLIFLDVELPDCMGFEWLHSMRNLLKKECNVIFFTAYNKYIINALREKAFDFLLKPIDQNELSIVLGRVLNEKGDKSEKKISQKENIQIILNTAKGDMLMITTNDISFFAYEENSRYWIAFLCNGEKYALKRSTKSDNILSFSDNFKMTDKSHIINIHSLVLINDGHCIMKPPFDGVENNITISKTKLLELRKQYPSI